MGDWFNAIYDAIEQLRKMDLELSILYLDSSKTQRWSAGSNRRADPTPCLRAEISYPGYTRNAESSSGSRTFRTV